MLGKNHINYLKVREATYTGRIFGSEEALKQGLVSQVYKNRDELLGNFVRIRICDILNRKCF